LLADGENYAGAAPSLRAMRVHLLHTQQATFDGRDRSGDFYVVDIWKKRGDSWQIIARYSSPMGKKFDCSPPR